MRDFRWVRAGVVATVLGCAAAYGQQVERGAGRPVAASVGEVMQDIASRAGVVFVGEVTSVERTTSQMNGCGVVEIAFQVLQPISGVTGPVYTMREWAGLWTGGRERLRVGQRAMFFLHAPGASGLSSPVDGAEGAVPLVPMGADEEPLLDVRRLQARVLRPVGAPLVDAENGAVSVSDAIAAVAVWNKGVAVEPSKRRLPAGVLPGAPR